jgi:hypothetical protein
MTTQPQMAPPTNALALAASILGVVALALAFLALLVIAYFSPLSLIIAWALSLLPGALAVIFGFIGITTANRMAGRRRKHAVWGVVLGFGALPFGLVLTLLVRFLGSALFGS